MGWDDEELKDLMAEERSRGRRPIDMATKRERQLLLKTLRRLLEKGDERGFLKVIRSAGIKDGTPEFLGFVRLWHEVQGR